MFLSSRKQIADTILDLLGSVQPRFIGCGLSPLGALL
jgi:hypothetical protein